MIGTPRAVNTGHELKRLRQRAIRQLVLERPLSSQREVVDALIEQGFAVTQATVSRDIAELGLHKAARDRRSRLRRPRRTCAVDAPHRTSVCAASSADIPVRIGRSGLTLVLTGSPGTASVIAQAIDESTLARAGGHARGRQYAPRPVRRRGPAGALAPAVPRLGAPGPPDSPSARHPSDAHSIR